MPVPSLCMLSNQLGAPVSSSCCPSSHRGAGGHGPTGELCLRGGSWGAAPSRSGSGQGAGQVWWWRILVQSHHHTIVLAASPWGTNYEVEHLSLLLWSTVKALRIFIIDPLLSHTVSVTLYSEVHISDHALTSLVSTSLCHLQMDALAEEDSSHRLGYDDVNESLCSKERVSGAFWSLWPIDALYAPPACYHHNLCWICCHSSWWLFNGATSLHGEI
jgi:hypothetical protein